MIIGIAHLADANRSRRAADRVDFRKQDRRVLLVAQVPPIGDAISAGDRAAVAT
jgi:hypothetical protein